MNGKYKKQKKNEKRNIQQKEALAENVMLMGFGVTNKVRMERKQIPFDARNETDDSETKKKERRIFC